MHGSYPTCSNTNLRMFDTTIQKIIQRSAKTKRGTLLLRFGLREKIRYSESQRHNDSQLISSFSGVFPVFRQATQ